MSTRLPLRYGRLSIGLHWLMLLLIAVVYACIELKGNFPKGSETRELLKHWHFMLGLAVFALVWLRLLARLIGPTPPSDANAPRWERIPARLMHLALYALMIGLPLLGWALLSAAGKPTPSSVWSYRPCYRPTAPWPASSRRCMNSSARPATG